MTGGGHPAARKRRPYERLKHYKKRIAHLEWLEKQRAEEKATAVAAGVVPKKRGRKPKRFPNEERAAVYAAVDAVIAAEPPPAAVPFGPSAAPWLEDLDVEPDIHDLAIKFERAVGNPNHADARNAASPDRGQPGEPPNHAESQRNNFYVDTGCRDPIEEKNGRGAKNLKNFSSPPVLPLLWGETPSQSGGEKEERKSTEADKQALIATEEPERVAESAARALEPIRSAKLLVASRAATMLVLVGWVTRERSRHTNPLVARVGVLERQGLAEIVRRLQHQLKAPVSPSAPVQMRADRVMSRLSGLVDYALCRLPLGASVLDVVREMSSAPANVVLRPMYGADAAASIQRRFDLAVATEVMRGRLVVVDDGGAAP